MDPTLFIAIIASLMSVALSVVLLLVLSAGAVVLLRSRRRRQLWLDAEEPTEYFDRDDPIETFVPASHRSPIPAPMTQIPSTYIDDDLSDLESNPLLREDVTRVDLAVGEDPFGGSDLATWREAAEEEEVQATEIFGACPEDFAKLGLVDPDDLLQ
ncbi:MAG TPA: hypothetical protein ENK18_21075 [Deltaproteobacteria bacterium]|nr:hypothetical protein [Deltaproteobacteria bacterium]